MLARVMTFQGFPNKVAESIPFFQQQATTVQGESGAKGAYVLIDPETGQGMTISLRDPSEAMQQSAPEAGSLREQFARVIGAQQSSTVHIYEVASPS